MPAKARGGLREQEGISRGPIHLSMVPRFQRLLDVVGQHLPSSIFVVVVVVFQ